MLRFALSATAIGLVLASAACAVDLPDDANDDGRVESSEAALKCKKTYVGDSSQECAVIRFVCPAGEGYFSNKRGCGCTTCP